MDVWSCTVSFFLHIVLQWMTTDNASVTPPVAPQKDQKHIRRFFASNTKFHDVDVAKWNLEKEQSSLSFNF